MEQRYDELVGGIGRSVYFRSRRFRPRAVAGKLPAELRIENAEVVLYDLSNTGLAYHVLNDRPIPPSGRDVSVQITIRGVSAFVGRGVIVRTEAEADRTKVALRLIDGVLDPAEVTSLHDRLLFETALARGIEAFSEVPPGYRKACAEVVLFLSHWRKLLDARELEVRKPPSPPQLPPTYDFETAAEIQMRAEWRSLRAVANEECASAFESEHVMAAAKLYTETVVTPLLLCGPIWERAYRKPLGYPGDYELMNYMYNEERIGGSAFARIIHQLGREERLAATVPARKELLIESIREAAAGQSTTDSLRIASIGSGPAREVQEFLTHDRPRGKVAFTLIDQDQAALEFANERLLRLVAANHDRVGLRCRFVSFAQLLSRADLIADMREHDLIYSAGLLDYLNSKIASALISRLFLLLRAGGTLLLGNAAMEPGIRWVPDLVLDWPMIYRSEADLRSLASGVPQPADIRVDRDPSGAWFFLRIHKR